MVKEEPAEAIRITLLVTSVLDQLGVQHLVGGSLASSLHGIPRSTNDVDVVAALSMDHVPPFVAALDQSFYVDADMIRDAIRRKSEFNVLHLATMFKVDVFVPRLDAVVRSELARAELYRVDEASGQNLRLASAEDIVLQKLAWYRAGGHSSERQWLDALGVVTIKGERLDAEYMRATAKELAVTDLLERLLAEAQRERL